MRAISRALIAVMVLMMCPTTVAVAGGGHDDRDRPSVQPANRVGGSSGGDLLKDWFAQNLAMKAGSSPFGRTANVCLDLGRRGQVVSPAGGVLDDTGTIAMTCPVDAGQAILMVGPSADCSSAEPEAFQADTARGQRKCALRWLFDPTYSGINVSIDGGGSVDIHNQRFLTISPQGRTVFDAEDPVFGAPKGAKATFVAAAWTAEIAGLRKGDHVVSIVTTGVNPDSTPFSYTFNVTFEVAGRR